MVGPIIVAVVDKERRTYGIVKALQKEAGIQASLIPSSLTAFETIEEEQPDLIILDSWLETRDAGWTLLEKLKNNPNTAHIPVIICTSDAIGLNARFSKIEQMDMVGVLFKPFEAQALLDMARCLAGHIAQTGDSSCEGTFKAPSPWVKRIFRGRKTMSG